MKPRFALIGAGRTRQGLGPFVARFLHGAGAEVCAHVGTSNRSIAATSKSLETLLGAPCPGFRDLRALHSAVQVDAVAILCPPEHHYDYLREAGSLRLHVLCEKPLVIRKDGSAWDALGGVQALTTSFAEHGLLLQENAQWPHVLPSFGELFGAPKSPPASFEMGLSPSGEGAQMALDSLSHPLSVLQALAPGSSRVEAVQIEGGERPGPRTIRFNYVTSETGSASARVSCAVFLEDSPLRPRPAWIKIDGHRADRLIRERDYAIFLADNARSASPNQADWPGPGAVAVPDPLQVHLEQFVETLDAVLAGGPPPSTTPLLQRAEMLHTLLQAFPASDRTTP